jgi:phage terminase large subunit
VNFLPSSAPLFGWQNRPVPVRPWEPEPLTHDAWPPNYKAVYAWRMQQLKLLSDPAMLASAKAYYSTHPMEFIVHWVDTYNPRKSNDKWMPFVFFKKQEEFIQFLHECRQDGENGLVEKARDMGATWACCAYSIWSWLFIANDAIGWGSRKEGLVDRLGDADSIFEKMRLLISRLPPCFLPSGFDPKKHATFMKFINPENGATITGEAGDNIGRGGRKSIYFKDESAHYERPEKIEAALGDNTNTQIDISSVNGLGNVFHRRREAGIEWTPGAQIEPGRCRVFVVDWRDHPEKTQEWFDKRKANFEREGMAHIFAQEVERNYSAAIVNTLIPFEYIRAAIDAHKVLPSKYPDRYKAADFVSENWSAALDVADDGIDRNALVKKQGVILRYARDFGERDPGVATRNVIGDCAQHKGKIKVQYDCIGIGAAVKSEFNRLRDDKETKELCQKVQLIPWNAAGSVQLPYERLIPDDDESPLNNDHFDNLKAQAWWALRTRFYKTWRAVTEGVRYSPDELISLDGSIPLIRQIEKELAQPTLGRSARSLKMIVNKKPDGTKSPNIADAITMAYFPMNDEHGVAVEGLYGNV